MQKYSTYVVQLPLNLFHFVILILTEEYLTFLVDSDFVKKYCQLCDKYSSSKNWLLLWFINSFINWAFASLPKVVFLIQIWWLQPLNYIAVHFTPVGIQLNPCKEITPSPKSLISVFYAEYNLLSMFSLYFTEFSDLEVIHWWFLPALSRWPASAREASRKFDGNLMKSWDRVTHHRQNTLNFDGLDQIETYKRRKGQTICKRTALYVVCV